MAVVKPLPNANRLDLLYRHWVSGDEHFLKANGRSAFLSEAEWAELKEAQRALRYHHRQSQGRKVLPQDFTTEPLPSGRDVFVPLNIVDHGPPPGRMAIAMSYDAVAIDDLSDALSVQLAGVEVGRVARDPYDPNRPGCWVAFQIPILRMGPFSAMARLAGGQTAQEAAEALAQQAAPQLNSPRTFFEVLSYLS